MWQRKVVCPELCLDGFIGSSTESSFYILWVTHWVSPGHDYKATYSVASLFMFYTQDETFLKISILMIVIIETIGSRIVVSSAHTLSAAFAVADQAATHTKSTKNPIISQSAWHAYQVCTSFTTTAQYNRPTGTHLYANGPPLLIHTLAIWLSCIYAIILVQKKERGRKKGLFCEERCRNTFLRALGEVRGQLHHFSAWYGMSHSVGQR